MKSGKEDGASHFLGSQENVMLISSSFSDLTKTNERFRLDNILRALVEHVG